MGRATLTAFVMNFSFRAIAAFDFGPGGIEMIFGPRSSFFVRFAMVSWLVRRPKGTPRSPGRLARKGAQDLIGEPCSGCVVPRLERRSSSFQHPSDLLNIVTGVPRFLRGLEGRHHPTESGGAFDAGR